METVRTRSSWMVFRALLAERQPFHTHGALRGEAGEHHSTGRLAGDDLSSFTRTPVDFVVYSYATPIAWHTIDGDWTMPSTRYSVTTSCHQSAIRTAISQLGVA